ncbi:MAG TPA: APC family permease [Bacteroidota bacterium]|nr:APC family permease [Bacteroidota bacterium]
MASQTAKASSIDQQESSPQLVRGIGLAGATSLNMIDMIGVGPFITIPLIIAAMGGPQAMLGWIIGAFLVMCDGLVWAELGAAMPGSGGSYRYLKEIYNPDKLGKLMSFLFIWQLTFSAPLSIASGCIGLSQYAVYLIPSLGTPLAQHDFAIDLPLIGPLAASIQITTGTFLAMAICLLAVFLLYRKITIVSRISEFLWIGVMLTIAWVIFSGVTHFNSERAFDFPPGAFTLSASFFNGLGAGMLVAIYDYWGYYNVCFLGGEIKEPGRIIPRAILYSILFVGVIYIVMNTSILGVIPWRELSDTATSDARKYIVSVFMERLYGTWAGIAVTVLIMWTAFASVFSLLLGYSRIPYAAASEGDYFRIFSRIHPRHLIPHVSLIVLGVVALLFCSLRLADVIAALVVIRILIQFLAQTVGVIVLRIRRPRLERPFRMWLYPLPALAAFVGFAYVLVMRPNFQKEIRYAVILIVLGLVLFLVRSFRSKQWPFRTS